MKSPNQIQLNINFLKIMPHLNKLKEKKALLSMIGGPLESFATDYILKVCILFKVNHLRYIRRLLILIFLLQSLMIMLLKKLKKSVKDSLIKIKIKGSTLIIYYLSNTFDRRSKNSSQSTVR